MGVQSFGYHDGCGHQAGQYGHRRSRPGKGMTGGRLRTALRLCCAGSAAGRLTGIGGRACTLFHQGIQRLLKLLYRPIYRRLYRTAGEVFSGIQLLPEDGDTLFGVAGYIFLFRLRDQFVERGAVG